MTSAQSPRDISRRGVITAGAWSVPVVVLAVATPAASASGGDPALVASGPSTVDSHTKIFSLALSNLPDIPPSEEGDFQGILIDFCLPEGLAILAVSPGSGWGFTGNDDDLYGGGDGYVFNTTAIQAGTTLSVQVTVGLDPTLESLEGILGADVNITTIYGQPVAWPYLYGSSTGTVLPNCAAPTNRR